MRALRGADGCAGRQRAISAAGAARRGERLRHRHRQCTSCDDQRAVSQRSPGGRGRAPRRGRRRARDLRGVSDDRGAQRSHGCPHRRRALAQPAPTAHTARRRARAAPRALGAPAEECPAWRRRAAYRTPLLTGAVMRLARIALCFGVLVGLAACSSSSSTTINMPAAQTIYVGNDGPTKSIETFSTLASGNATPTTTITGALTTVASPLGIAVDSAGFIYEAEFGHPIINVFSPGSTGNVAPVRTITSVSSPLGLAVDAAGDLFVADRGATNVKVYGPGAMGAAVPLRTISVAAAGMTDISYLCLDNVGNLYVGGESSAHIAVYPAATASGNPVPLHNISGVATGLLNPYGMSTDALNNLYVADYGTQKVSVFPLGADGNVAPARTITSSGPAFVNIYGTAIDNRGNLYVNDNNTNTIFVFPPTASGATAPSATIVGAGTGLSNPWGLAVH